jgi:tricorn protease-like protein
MPKKRKPQVVSFEDLHGKSTKELLGYLKKLHQCEESFEMTDLLENPDLRDDSTIYFKQTSKWKTAYSDVKRILSNREHLD